MKFDDALPMLEEGKAMYSDLLGVTMFRKNDENRLTFVVRQRNKPQPALTHAVLAESAVLIGDWVLSGIEPKGEAA